MANKQVLPAAMLKRKREDEQPDAIQNNYKLHRDGQTLVPDNSEHLSLPNNTTADSEGEDSRRKRRKTRSTATSGNTLATQDPKAAVVPSFSNPTGTIVVENSNDTVNEKLEVEERDKNEDATSKIPLPVPIQNLAMTTQPVAPISAINIENLTRTLNNKGKVDDVQFKMVFGAWEFCQ